MKGRKSRKRPPVCKSGDSIGRLSRDLAGQIGLKNSPLLVEGGHDQPVCAVGAGVTEDWMGLDTTGTAEVFSVTYPEKILTLNMHDSFYSCYDHVVPGQYFTYITAVVPGSVRIPGVGGSETAES
ncbi:hypothetical protein [Faecalicatena contorta]|uniref:hypothetical protein n=1 Tax=Faecalicatena contorta TaxID=39482 RepID=UPI0018971B3B|nr:hypothetical protein [Faecalicatena contorta]